MNHRNRTAHDMLDAARAGVPLSEQAINWALARTGDLPSGALSPSEQRFAKRFEERPQNPTSRARAHLTEA